MRQHALNKTKGSIPPLGTPPGLWLNRTRTTPDSLKGIGMSTLAFEPRAKKVSFDEDNMWVELADGWQLGVPLAYFPRLLDATQAQRDGYIISGGGSGLHWEKLDKDISVKFLLLGIGDRTRHARKAS